MFLKFLKRVLKYSTILFMKRIILSNWCISGTGDNEDTCGDNQTFLREQFVG